MVDEGLEDLLSVVLALNHEGRNVGDVGEEGSGERAVLAARVEGSEVRTERELRARRFRKVRGGRSDGGATQRSGAQSARFGGARVEEAECGGRVVVPAFLLNTGSHVMPAHAVVRIVPTHTNTQ